MADESLSLKPCERIRGDARFERIRRQGVRAGDGLLFVRALSNGLDRTRVGVAVGRSAGRAVRRTRLRRMLREAFRLSRGRLPAGLDLLLSPRKGSAEAPLAELQASLVQLAARAAAELEKRGREPEG
jgi:ribonuclease P protein component